MPQETLFGSLLFFPAINSKAEFNPGRQAHPLGGYRQGLPRNPVTLHGKVFHSEELSTLFPLARELCRAKCFTIDFKVEQYIAS